MSDPLLGKLVWYELLTTDISAAEQFYTDIIGWTAKPFDTGTGHPYRVVHNVKGTGIGGVMPLPEGMNYPPHWVMYVAVPKLEDAVAQIERLGGRALSPVIEIPDVGRIRTMLDPQGAMFAIIQPASSERQPDAEPEIGDASWRELYTTDAEAAVRFYNEVFGWTEMDAMDMGPGMGKYHMFGRSFMLGGIMNKMGDMQHLPTSWNIYFRVPDVDAAAEQVKAKGGQVLSGPMDVPGGGRIVQCQDPQGAAFSLHRAAAS
jgi:uncharacterized protein